MRDNGPLGPRLNTLDVGDTTAMIQEGMSGTSTDTNTPTGSIKLFHKNQFKQERFEFQHTPDFLLD